MKFPVALSLSCLLAAGCAHLGSGGGWQPLFNADLSNAHAAPGVWTVDKGVMTASRDEVVWSTNQYENFTIDLEFRLAPGANSGILVYCTDPKNWIPNAVEIQILDDTSHEWKTAAPRWRCGAIFGHLAPSKAAA